MPETTPCRSCGKPIRWARSATSGAAMPLDPEPDRSRGNVSLSGDGRATVLASPALEAAVLAGEPLYLSHHASCPFAARHRRK